jgi:transposase
MITNGTYLNSESIYQLLFKLANLGLNIPIILVLDNAKYQKFHLVQNYAKQLEEQLFYLPSYSPQLNLIERFWKFIRNERLYSKSYANFADFKAAIYNWIVTANTDK